jgi:hypothetical protein
MSEIKLTREDNDVILQHIDRYNDGRSISDKCAMDSYIHRIVFKDTDILFDIEVIKAKPPIGCTEDHIGASRDEVGSRHILSISEIDPELKIAVNAAIREIKVNRCLDETVS